MVQAPSSASPNIWHAVGLLIATGSLLGLSAIWAKASGSVGWPPMALLLWAMVGGAAIQTVGQVLRRRVPMPGGSALVFSVFSGILFAIPNAMAFSAVQHVGAGFVALCFAFPLMLTYALALALRLDRFNGQKLLGVLFGVAGGVVLATAKTGVDGGYSPWSLVALAVPVILAIANIYRSVYWPKGSDSMQMSIGMLVFGAATMVAVLLLFGIDFGPVAWNAESAGLLAAQSVTFAVLYDVYFRLQKLAGPVYLSQIGSAAAVTGIALAYLIFTEIPSIQQSVAAILVAIGLVLVNRAMTRQTRAAA
jgi:drug/metabolite transporter (DMT)-like permease